MKIYLNREPKTGPWGGGNKFVSELGNRLESLGHEVVYDLYHYDVPIDLIFCFDPRPNKSGQWYEHLLAYKNRFGCKIIQRVGDVGTHGKPELTRLVKETVKYSDFLIFPSNWAKDYIGHSAENYSIIYNAPLKIFHKYKNSDLLDDQINLITHHWSTNPKKGFSFYRQLDEFIGKNKNFSLTFIGRLPNDFHFQNAIHIPATGDNDFLAKKISDSDIYVTASEEEAGANHVLEALAAGLPILYHANGGSIPEYCKLYGEHFVDLASFAESLNKVSVEYKKYKDKVLAYEHTIGEVVSRYKGIIGAQI
tara:strand:+ start:1120 stop:2043 length:924 start_codon:yes stop_codon:yes gene_type:complete